MRFSRDARSIPRSALHLMSIERVGVFPKTIRFTYPTSFLEFAAHARWA
jgi:hypothetical protein